MLLRRVLLWHLAHVRHRLHRRLHLIRHLVRHLRGHLLGHLRRDLLRCHVRGLAHVLLRRVGRHRLVLRGVGLIVVVGHILLFLGRTLVLVKELVVAVYI